MNTDVRAVRFVNWWDRNWKRHETTPWPDAFLSYFGDKLDELSPRELLGLYDDAAQVYHERKALDPGRYGRWVKAEPEGMILTDFEDIPDGDVAEAA